MQERRNKRLFILLIISISATVALLWLGNDQRTFRVDKNMFNNYDLQLVDQVKFTAHGITTDLKYNGSKWLVNDKYEADRNLIQVLFATLKQAEPKRPVANALKDSINNMLEQKGVKVDVLIKGKSVANFVAGGNEAKTQAFFKNIDQKESYVMVIPGYRVYVSGIFELKQNEWRDKLIFPFNWGNFQSLQVQHANPQNNFNVAMKDGFFQIKELQHTDTTKLNNFLNDVSLLTVDQFLETNPSLDSISTNTSDVTILVKDVGNREFSLSVYKSKTQNVYYGLINKRQWAVIKANYTTKIIKPLQFFRLE